MPATREERDTLGTIKVDARRLWGAQTQRSLEHFAISTERLPTAFIRALAVVKGACATVNSALGLLPPDRALAIVRAAQEVAEGRLDAEFPLSVWQTGSGTQTNMNMNEVLANRGSELLGGGRGAQRLLHPNDDVNLGQSSNDVFPTAMHVAAVRCIADDLLPALDGLQATLYGKVQSFDGIVKMGRTHLQDAVPLTLGQVFSGYVAQLEQARASMQACLALLYPLAIGGTAVGTGLNTHPAFGERVAAELASTCGLPFTRAPNAFAALAAHDVLVQVHGALKALAVALVKIANDVCWLASGPRGGLGEITLPENEPGSSIMPGKINPTQSEALVMLCGQVIGNDAAITFGAASGNFELNVCKPLIAHNLLQSIRLLADGMRSFDMHCARGIEADRERIALTLSRSLMLVTALVPHIGYDCAAQVAKLAHHEGLTLTEAAVTLGYATPEELGRWLDPLAMVGGQQSLS